MSPKILNFDGDGETTKVAIQDSEPVAAPATAILDSKKPESDAQGDMPAKGQENSEAAAASPSVKVETLSDAVPEEKKPSAIVTEEQAKPLPADESNSEYNTEAGPVIEEKKAHERKAVVDAGAAPTEQKPTAPAVEKLADVTVSEETKETKVDAPATAIATSDAPDAEEKFQTNAPVVAPVDESVEKKGSDSARDAVPEASKVEVPPAAMGDKEQTAAVREDIDALKDDESKSVPAKEDTGDIAPVAPVPSPAAEPPLAKSTSDAPAAAESVPDSAPIAVSTPAAAPDVESAPPPPPAESTPDAVPTCVSTPPPSAASDAESTPAPPAAEVTPAAKEDNQATAADPDFNTEQGLSDLTREGTEFMSKLPEEIALGIINDIERPSSPVAQILRQSARPAGDEPKNNEAESAVPQKEVAAMKGAIEKSMEEQTPDGAEVVEKSVALGDTAEQEIKTDAAGPAATNSTTPHVAPVGVPAAPAVENSTPPAPAADITPPLPPAESTPSAGIPVAVPPAESTAAKEDSQVPAADSDFNTEQGLSDLHREGSEIMSKLPEALALGIIKDIERPSSPVAQMLRTAVPPAGAPAVRPSSATDSAETEAELRNLIREGCEVLEQLPEGMAADIIDSLKHSPESPVCAVIATPIAPAPAPAPFPGDDAAVDGAEGGGVRPYAEAETEAEVGAGPGAGRARQLPPAVSAEVYNAAAGRREEAARRVSDACKAGREQELQKMALRLETTYEELAQQKREHDAAIQKVPMRAPGLVLATTQLQASQMRCM